MLRTRPMRALPVARRSLLPIAFLGLAVGCGSDVRGPNADNAFTVAEATTVDSASFSEVSRVLATAGFDRAPDALASAVPQTTTRTVNGTCTAGGAIGGSYT